MSRYLFFICTLAGLASVPAAAQVLPKHPTIQQVVSYRQWQEQSWRKQQLPLNSVLYRYDQKNFNWPKIFLDNTSMAQPVISLRQYIPLNLAGALNNTYAGVTMQRQPVRWRDPDWWKDPNQQLGANILREIIVHNIK